MSSVDGARAFQISSDVIISQTCDPCYYNGKQIEAINYCGKCDEYLCVDCRDNHKEFRSHQIFSLKDAPSRPALHELTSDTSVICSCDQNSEATFHCWEHEDVICETCKTLKHRKCKPVSIKKEDTSDAIYNLRSIMQRAGELREKINRRVCEKREELEQLAILKKTCQKEINAFRKEINTIVDSLEEDSYKELENLESEQRLEIEEHISACTTTDQMLEADIRFAETIIKTKKNDQIYAADVKISNRLKQYSTSLEDCFNRLLKPVLTFKRKEELIKALKNAPGLLAFAADNNSVNILPENQKDVSFLKMRPNTSRQVDITTPGQTKNSYISGCVFLPEGELVLCDYNNNKVRLFSWSFILKSSLDLRTRPWDASAINNNTAIVTLPESSQLQYIAVGQSLNTGRVIQLDKPCWGVDVAGEKIYVTCHNSGFFTRDGEIRLLDLEGHSLRTLGINANGSFILQRPYYISASVTSGKTFVSDAINNTFTFFKSDGTTPYLYKDPDLKWPRGFCLDGDDNAIVCDNVSHNVQIITAEGNLHKIFLRDVDGIKSPMSVAYRHKDNTVVVGCENQNVLFVVKDGQRQFQETFTYDFTS